jgi:hypothetical protein
VSQETRGREEETIVISDSFNSSFANSASCFELQERERERERAIERPREVKRVRERERTTIGFSSCPPDERKRPREREKRRERGPQAQSIPLS